MTSCNVIKLVEIILVNISLRVELETHSVTMNAENWQLSCAFTDKRPIGLIRVLDAILAERLS